MGDNPVPSDKEIQTGLHKGLPPLSSESLRRQPVTGFPWQPEIATINQRVVKMGDAHGTERLPPVSF